MIVSTIADKLIEIHRSYQAAGGYEDGEAISEQTCPLADLQGFDSQFIPEIVRRLARELGHPLTEGARVKNIYVSADRRRKLTIKQIAERFAASYIREEVACEHRP